MHRRDFLGAGAAAPAALLGQHSTRSFAEAFELFWSRTWTYTLEVADAMPAADWDFRPVPEIRTFAEQMVHIAQGHYAWASTIRGRAVEDAPDFAAIGSDPTDIRAALDSSFDAVLRAVLARTDAELDSRVPWGRRLGVARSHSLRGVALTAWHHTAHHRGQCVIYLRLNGITPPGYVD